MFNQFWSLYPARHGRKVGKAVCAVVFAKFAGSEQILIVQAAQHYANACHAKGEFVPLPRDPIRFLKQDWWRDWVDKPVNQSTQGLPVVTAAIAQAHGISMHEALKDWPEGLAKLERILQHGPALSQPSRGK